MNTTPQKGKQTMRISTKRFNAIHRKTNGHCAYCGILLDSEICIDHIIPRSRNGKDTVENLLLCCRSCNSRKKNRTLEEYRSFLLVDSIENSCQSMIERIDKYRHIISNRDQLPAVFQAIETLLESSKVIYMKFWFEEMEIL